MKFTTPHYRRSGRSAGFTLMEMILVLLIIVALMGMVIFKMSTNVDDANITSARGSVSQLETTLLRYKVLTGHLPTQQEGLEILVSPAGGKSRQAFLKQGALTDPWGRIFQYRNPAQRSGGDFDVFSYGPDGQENTADDVGNW